MTQEVARKESEALARPSFIKEGDLRGTENIQSSDIKPPALRLAQSMSPEVKRSEPQFIKDLREGELFNSITREVYGEGPVRLVFINYLGHQNIEFDPNDRNTVLDGAVPDGDPRTEFTFKTEAGKQVRVRPRATKFANFVVHLYINGRPVQLMTLSLKSTQLKKATQLLTIFKLSKFPSFAYAFDVTIATEHRGANTWYGWKFTPAGWVSEEQYNAASAAFESFKGKTIVAETEGDPTADREEDSDIPF